jgi:hypothetical protein
MRWSLINADNPERLYNTTNAMEQIKSDGTWSKRDCDLLAL